MAASPCKICKKNQVYPGTGTAPPRPTPNNRTCYLNVDNFSDFRYDKEMAKKIREKTAQLLNINENFTNSEIDIDKLLDILQTEDIVSLKQKVRDGELSLSDINSADTVIEKIKPEANENCGTRSPITCPLSGCHQPIGATSVLTHFLLQHRKRFHALNYKEIKDTQSSKLEFAEKLMNFGDIVSLGILLYAGAGDTNENSPGQLGICRPNSFLPDRYHHFVNHLPVIVMASKVCNSALFADRDTRKQMFDPEDTTKEILILWLNTVDTTKPMYGTITVYDRDGTSSRSSVIKLRSVKDEQDPNEFVTKDVNYLRLSRGEMNVLSNFGTNNIYLEIFIQDF